MKSAGPEIFIKGSPSVMGVAPAAEDASSLARRVGDSGLGASLADLPGPFVLASGPGGPGGPGGGGGDRGASEVVLARDRLGRFRIFYHVGPEGVSWDTDLLALAHRVVPGGLSAMGLQEILAYRWSQGAETSLTNIRLVEPGTLVRIGTDGQEKKERFWTFPVDPGPDEDPFERWVDRADAAVAAGVAQVLEGARRPFVLLSGGVDSSLLAAMGHRIRPDLVAVTPTWDGHPDPELPRAEAFARHLGIEHRVMVFKSQDVSRFVPQAIRYFGGPIRDYHMVVLAWVFDVMAAEGFDLVLHGQAGDTVFGFGNIVYAENFAEKRRLLRFLPDRLLRAVGSRIPDSTDLGRRAGDLLRMDTETAFRRRQRLIHRKPLRRRHPRWLKERDPAPGAAGRVPRQASTRARIQISDFYQGTVSHMVTLSAISEPVGLAVGYPFLSQEVLDLTMTFPDALKIRDGETKPVLKEVAARYYPREWVMAPKLGFPTPKVEWLRGPLSAWVEERLGPGRFSRKLLGDTTIDSLRLPDDFELIWTLSNLEEFLELAFPGRPTGEVQVLEP